MTRARARILVIKHGALGDVVLATGPFQAIRAHHADAYIVALTTPPFAPLLKQSGYFDEIWIDERPKLRRIGAFLKAVRRIQAGKFERIYDLQTSDRTAWYFRLLPKPRPEWVGTVKGASHRHDTLERTQLHTTDRQRQQLANAGIDHLPKPNLDWLASDIRRFALPSRYALIVAGGSAHRPGKRWPQDHYVMLCRWLAGRGILPVLLGTQAEKETLAAITQGCRAAKNLTGSTDLADIATMARGAAVAVGNDTGPMHVIAAAGCSSLVLFSADSDPALCAPRGTNVAVLQEADLGTLEPERVIAELGKLLTIARKESAPVASPGAT